MKLILIAKIFWCSYKESWLSIGDTATVYENSLSGLQWVISILWKLCHNKKYNLVWCGWERIRIIATFEKVNLRFNCSTCSTMENSRAVGRKWVWVFILFGLILYLYFRVLYLNKRKSTLDFNTEKFNMILK